MIFSSVIIKYINIYYLFNYLLKYSYREWIDCRALHCQFKDTEHFIRLAPEFSPDVEDDDKSDEQKAHYEYRCRSTEIKKKFVKNTFKKNVLLSQRQKRRAKQSQIAPSAASAFSVALVLRMLQYRNMSVQPRTMECEKGGGSRGVMKMIYMYIFLPISFPRRQKEKQKLTFWDRAHRRCRI